MKVCLEQRKQNLSNAMLSFQTAEQIALREKKKKKKEKRFQIKVLFTIYVSLIDVTVQTDSSDISGSEMFMFCTRLQAPALKETTGTHRPHAVQTDYG